MDSLAVAVTWIHTRRRSEFTTETRKPSLQEVMWQNGALHTVFLTYRARSCSSAVRSSQEACISCEAFHAITVPYVLTLKVRMQRTATTERHGYGTGGSVGTCSPQDTYGGY